MASFSVRVVVLPKPGVLDPQGTVVSHSLQGLGFQGVKEVRVGKVFDLSMDAPDVPTAEAGAKEMAQRLLANPVLETFRVEVSGR